MSKTRKIRIVRLGDAKRLTKGGQDHSIELNMQPKEAVG
jgi:hypothetical protein